MADANLPAPAAGAIPLDAGPVAPSGDWRERTRQFFAEPAFQRALPGLVGIGVIAVIAALYLAIADGPQRILYSDLSDAERGKVVQALEAGGIGYNIDNSTGAITVSETDVYRARMLVASDAGLAAPEGASAMLDAIPLGSSRTLEGERLRLARERELMLTIREIDGIESVRVHLATPERSVFVRENNPPSASVMLRLANGRSLAQNQVEAIVNLVSGSVPGMTPDNVRVVDQNGRLLSSPSENTLDSLLLQREFEAKLREQLSTLLLPLLGEGNFSTQVQVELDHNEMTSARESYDQDGSVRSESERSSTRMAANGGVGGVPGVPANTPPPDAELVDGAPEAQDGEAEPNQPAPTEQESSTQRNYELGREVAVTSTRPGGLVKLSVAIAVSDTALEAAAPMTAEQLQSLVSAAVGADDARGDQVQVVVSAFDSTEMPPLAFYEEKWFADILRYATALIAVLLVLLLAVRPLINAMRGPAKKKDDTKKLKKPEADAEAEPDEEDTEGGPAEGQSAEGAAGTSGNPQIEQPHAAAITGSANAVESGSELIDDNFTQKVDLARQLVSTQPDRAVEALQRMLEIPIDEPNGAPAR